MMRAVCAAAVSCIAAMGWAGELEPSSTPAPTPGPEPRTPISALPFTITESGSYYLTGDLALPINPGADGIRIQASDVTLDLMGFTISPTLGTTDDGIAASPEANGITVLNGTIRDWGNVGLDLFSASDCHVERILSINNGSVGIQVGDNAIVSHCRSKDNESVGFIFGSEAIITDCISLDNAATGFSVGFLTTLENCIATGNAGSGYFTQAGVLLSNCMARDNTANGIDVGGGSSVIECVSRFNDGVGISVSSNSIVESSVSNSNGSHGIQATASRVIDCVSSNNGVGGDGFGIRLFSENVVDGNQVRGNDAGIVEGTGDVSGNLVVRNRVSDNGTGADIDVDTAENTVGPIVSGAGVILTTSPWANFSP